MATLLIVQQQKTKCPYHRPFVREIHQSLVFPLTKEQQCRKYIISIEIIQKFIPGEQVIYLMAYFIDAYESVDFKEFTHIC